ncbi:hypothetical protein Salat_2784000 [Sesamum alatum]|uniref:RNase H type-1 domain-containing protein n=1 Tax=Sesamum alatum TaxID=300844 RepID=A0AAE1XLR0_9LAMI|nr:hypothetical protein Salat_2784000 [Sesamum alatum]
MSYLQVFNEVSAAPHPQHIVPHPTCWLHPPAGAIKINFDGATFNPTHEKGISVVARDSFGNCIPWISHRLSRPASPLIAEALAAREAISLALSLGLNRVIMEGDYITLLHLLRSTGDDNFVFGPLVNEIPKLCSHINCVFSFVRRSGNTVAHELAKHSGVRVVGSSLLP